MISIYFYSWRMEDVSFQSPLVAPAYIPTQNCKRASFWSLIPARSRNPNPEAGSSPTLIFEARFRPECQSYQGSEDMRNSGVTKNVVCRCSCRYTDYHTQNSNHLDQNIDIIWHKRSTLVNDNTAEYNLKKKRNYHETIYDGAIGIKGTS